MSFNTRSKIVATVGPSSDSPEAIGGLVKAGVDVFRINAAHCTPKKIGQLIRRIRKVDRLLKAGVGVMVDLQGPKIRVGSFLNAEPIWLQSGMNLIISTEPGLIGEKAASGETTRIGTRYAGFAGDVKPRERILLDDGNIELRVVKVEGTEVMTRVVYGGLLKQHKGINLPGSKVSTDCLTADDLADLEVALDRGADFIALSFVRSHRDIERLQEHIDRLGSDAEIIAKIERPEAVQDLTKIVAVSDALMVARGDLGVEMGPELVPGLQKRIIRAAVQARKPVITATQMLESMVINPRPTRAEASDVANAIYDGTSAVMLSAETASGRYPIQAVRIMNRILRESERDIFSAGSELRLRRDPNRRSSVTLATARASVYAAMDVGAKAIAVFTEAGGTVRAVATERAPTQVLAFTPYQRTVQRLSLVWGVQAIKVSRTRTSHEMTLEAEQILLDRKLAKPGDTIVVVVGASRKQGLTNIMNIRTLEPRSPRR